MAKSKEALKEFFSGIDKDKLSKDTKEQLELVEIVSENFSDDSDAETMDTATELMEYIEKKEPDAIKKSKAEEKAEEKKDEHIVPAEEKKDAIEEVAETVATEEIIPEIKEEEEAKEEEKEPKAEKKEKKSVKEKKEKEPKAEKEEKGKDALEECRELLRKHRGKRKPRPKPTITTAIKKTGTSIFKKVGRKLKEEGSQDKLTKLRTLVKNFVGGLKKLLTGSEKGLDSFEGELEVMLERMMPKKKKAEKKKRGGSVDDDAKADKWRKTITELSVSVDDKGLQEIGTAVLGRNVDMAEITVDDGEEITDSIADKLDEMNESQLEKAYNNIVEEMTA